MALAAVVDNDVSGDRRYPTATEMALMRRDIESIRKVLDGSAGEKGLVARVDELTEISDRGRWSLKIVLWVGGAAVALLTAAAQMKSLVTGWFITPPGH